MTDTPSCVASPEAYPVAERDKPANLVAAICAVMTDVGAIAATGYNSYDQYGYASTDDLLRQVQPAMARAGLVLLPVAIELGDAREDLGRKKDQRGLRASVTYKLAHAGGEEREVVVLAEAVDRLDKVYAKVMTNALKTALKQVFALPVRTAEDDQPASAAPGPQRNSRPSRAERFSVDLRQEVIPGRDETWLDLGLDHYDWVRDAATGALAERQPSCALYRDACWVAHAKELLTRLDRDRRRGKRLAQVEEHTSGLDASALDWMASALGDEGAKLAREAGSAAEFIAACFDPQLSELKKALAGEGYDVDAPVDGWPSKAEG